MSLLVAFRLILHHRTWTLTIPSGAFLLVVALSLLQGWRYRAESTFVRQATEPTNAPGIAGLAAQFGVQLGGRSGESPQLYASLATSRGLLKEAATTTYRFPESTGAADTLGGTIAELYELEGHTEADVLREAVDLLERDVSAAADMETGAVTVATTARWSALAVLLNDRILELINQFNTQHRQSQAVAEREFIERRLAEAERELEAAEGELEAFLSQNRTYETSPELSFAAARLERRVDLQQQVFTSLAQAYEQARIGEVRDTPVITVVEKGGDTVDATAGAPLFRGLLVWVLLFIIAMAGVVTHEIVRKEVAEAPAEAAEVREALGNVVGEFVPRRLTRSLPAVR